MRSDEAIDPGYLAISAPYSAKTLPFDVANVDAVRANRKELFGGLTGRMANRVQINRSGDLTRFIPENPRPGHILYMHGGGWALCDTTTHAAIMTDLAATAGMTVLGVDYPLAPEHPYPHALDMLADCVEKVAADHPDAPLVLAGDSAGANLALGLATRLRNENGPKVDALILFYGCYRHLFDTESHRLYGGGEHGLTTEGMRTYWQLYLSSHPDPQHGDLAQLDPTDLPPAFIADASLDCLQDDSIWLATQFSEAGINATRHTTPGVPHGFLHYTGLYEPAFDALASAGRWLRLSLSH